MYSVTTTVYDHTLRVTQKRPCDHHHLRLDVPVVLDGEDLDLDAIELGLDGNHLLLDTFELVFDLG